MASPIRDMSILRLRIHAARQSVFLLQGEVYRVPADWSRPCYAGVPHTQEYSQPLRANISEYPDFTAV